VQVYVVVAVEPGGGWMHTSAVEVGPTHADLFKTDHLHTTAGVEETVAAL